MCVCRCARVSISITAGTCSNERLQRVESSRELSSVKLLMVALSAAV